MGPAPWTFVQREPTDSTGSPASFAKGSQVFATLVPEGLGRPAHRQRGLLAFQPLARLPAAQEAASTGSGGALLSALFGGYAIEASLRDWRAQGGSSRGPNSGS
mmetsp:Transcript_28474/g.34839  ORF Transcript_28474/g.34839 Transcript_28474/m.34839 type:complete len:104 (-) Transcript_28474:7-318(-)